MVKSFFHGLTIDVYDELVHEVSLLGENIMETQTERDAVDRLTSIGGIIHGVEHEKNRLSIFFTHDPLTALKSLHEVVTHHRLRGIRLKENLKQITIKGSGLARIKSIMMDHLNEPKIHYAYFDPLKIILTVDQSAVDEIKNLI